MKLLADEHEVASDVKLAKQAESLARQLPDLFDELFSDEQIDVARSSFGLKLERVERGKVRASAFGLTAYTRLEFFLEEGKVIGRLLFEVDILATKNAAAFRSVIFAVQYADRSSFRFEGAANADWVSVSNMSNADADPLEFHWDFLGQLLHALKVHALGA